MQVERSGTSHQANQSSSSARMQESQQDGRIRKDRVHTDDSVIRQSIHGSILRVHNKKESGTIGNAKQRKKERRGRVCDFYKAYVK
mmetsp:Transcript_11685/g.22426  ORF Transcript_11685/g.22426 Transcript_11685/m.22426 type:complete len:86 (-) Transcript_11685:1380-1637(-)